MNKGSKYHFEGKDICENKHKYNNKFAILYLNHFLISLLLHLLQLNSMLILLLQLLHGLLHLFLLVTLSTRLHLTPQFKPYIIEHGEDDEGKHDPQKHVILEQPTHILQILDLNTENTCN